MHKWIPKQGHEYVPQAVEHGAAVLVVDDRYVIESRSGPVILTEHMKVNVYELIRDRNSVWSQ